MKPQLKTESIILFVSLALSSLSPALAVPEQPLKLDDYLAQVRSEHLGMKGSMQASQGEELRSQEAQLITSPTLYATFESKSDSKITPFSFISYDQLQTNVASLGVMENTSFGLNAKLHYDLFTTQYINPNVGNNANLAAFASFFSTKYILFSPVLELSQSLWSNGFGRSTRASQDAIEANALALSFTHQFQNQTILTQAEATYWRLAIARQIITVENQAIDRAQKIYEWNKNRTQLHLGDEADLIQAKALLQSRALDLLASQNEERAAARAFNQARNRDTEGVPETLTSVELGTVDQIPIPQRAPMRTDVKAARESARAAEANSIMQIEKNRPTFDLYGSLSLNGQPPNLNADPYNGAVSYGQSFGLSFQTNRPSYTLGFKFAMPLALEAKSNTQEGWRQEKIASETLYERKLYEQEQNWKDLNQSLTETKQHLALSQELEITQKNKLDLEKERLRRGRTTTYQVLLFEQDYLFAQLGRIKDQLATLTLITQLKLFGAPL